MSNKLSKNHWRADANCKDADTKIFTSFDPAVNAKAKAMCKTCPVQKPCLIDGFDTPWIVAGMTRYERLMKVWHRIDDEADSNFEY